MPVFNPPSPAETLDDTDRVMNGHGSFFASASTPMATPSPLIDAIDAHPIPNTRRDLWSQVEEFRNVDLGVIKIGQTSLHNPGGKSSWIGL